MNDRFTMRLLLSLGYLGVVLALGGLLYRHLSRFDGVVVAAVGGSESMAIRPAGDAWTISPHRRMPLEVLPLDQRDAALRVLDPTRTYDAVALGFSLSIPACKVLEHPPDREIIEIRRGKTLETIAALPGQAFSEAGLNLTVVSVEPWAGLVRDAAGEPMAAFSFQEHAAAPWVQGLFLRAQSPPVILPGLSLQLRWFANESEAKSSFPTALRPLDGARWCIHDGQRVHWLETLIPGSGMTASDGAEYTLTGVVRDAGAGLPSLQVSVHTRDSETQVAVPANRAEPTQNIRFECPAVQARHLRWHTWRDGSTLLTVYHNGRVEQETRLLQEGETVTLPGGIVCRFDQVMAQGLPIGTRGAPVRVANVSIGAETLRLREGLAVRWEESVLRYRRLPQPALVSYRITARGRGGIDRPSTLLEHGKSVTLNGWTFRQDDENLHNEQIAVLHASRLFGTQVQLLGALMVCVGAIGWVFLRVRHKPSSHGRDSERLLDDDDGFFPDNMSEPPD